MLAAPSGLTEVEGTHKVSRLASTRMRILLAVVALLALVGAEMAVVLRAIAATPTATCPASCSRAPTEGSQEVDADVGEVASVAEQSSAAAQEVAASSQQTVASAQEIIASAQELTPQRRRAAPACEPLRAEQAPRLPRLPIGGRHPIMSEHPLSDTELEVTAATVKQRFDAGEVQVIDVREQYEWDAGRIPGDVRHIELEHLSSQAATIDKDKPVIFQCRLGARSLMAAQAFRRAGYDAYSLTGGLQAWHDAGLPLDPPDGTVADH